MVTFYSDMSWCTGLLVAVCVVTSQSAFCKTLKDVKLNRIARSPHYGSSYHHDEYEVPPPPPSHGPPPPITYHTQNWSGVTKGIGGTPEGVFSGAAASAQSTAPASSEAFSIAASGTGPVALDKDQVQENIAKSGFDGHSKHDDSDSNYSAGSSGNMYGGKSIGQGNSDEGQYNIKSSGLESEDGFRSRTKESKSQSDQYNGRKINGYTSSMASYKLGQRNTNFDFDNKFGSVADRNLVRSSAVDNDSQLGQYYLQSSHTRGFNEQSDQYNAASSGLDNKPADIGYYVNSGKRFGQNIDQPAVSGYRAGGVIGTETHGGGYGARREFGDQHDHSNHHISNNRYGKSRYEPRSFEQTESDLSYQSDAGKGYGENQHSRSSEFSNTFGNTRSNYGSISRDSDAGYSGNQGHVESFGKLNTGFREKQADSQDISDTQKIKQLYTDGSDGLSESRTSTNIQSQSSASKYGASNKGALVAGNKINGDEDGGTLSTGVNASGQEDVQSTLGSALNLASQGLQAAHQTPCSTCDKSSYALSNAKSHSGSAIALSIGG